LALARQLLSRQDEPPTTVAMLNAVEGRSLQLGRLSIADVRDMVFR